jgi:hypothetical protein
MAGKQPVQGESQSGSPQGRNTWDFLIVTVVITAIVVLTIWLIAKYPRTPSTVESILGIVIPAFAAVFGVTVGYAGGHVTGQARGRELGKQEVKGPLLQRLNELSQQAAVMDTIRTHAENPAGSNRWLLRTTVAGKQLDLGTTEDLDLAGKINNMRDYVAGL